MPSSFMWKNVLQATLLATINILLDHYLWIRVGSQIPDEVYLTYHDNPQTLEEKEKELRMVSSELALAWLRDIIRQIFLCTCQYHWHISLERLLPTRPRVSGTTVPPQQPTSENMDDDREEEVVRKWIAQGKVKRASVSWGNILLKWLLDTFIGGIWRTVLYLFATFALKFSSPMQIYSKVKETFLLNYIASVLWVSRLTALVGFIVIPAPKRIVFEAAGELLWSTFINTAIGVLVPTILKSEFFQESIRKSIEEKARNSTLINGTAVVGLGDEL